MVQWTIHQDSLNAQTSPQPGLSSMALTPTHRRVQELTPRKVDFAQLDTVVEELVNSTA